MNLRFFTNAPFFLAGVSLLAGILTYAVLTRSYPFGGDPETIIALFVVDLTLLLALTVVILRRVVKLWVAAKSGRAGSKLHARFVTIFSLLAIIPSVLMATFLSFFFFFAMQSWFDDKVKSAVTESVSVAEAYLKEHQQNIRSDVLLMARDINAIGISRYYDPSVFQDHLYNLALIHNVNEALIFDRAGTIIARFGLTFSIHLDQFTNTDFERAAKGDIILKSDQIDKSGKSSKGDIIRALIKLDNLADSYLLIGRYVDGQVLQHIENTKQASDAYSQLDSNRGDLEQTGIALYLLVSLLLLLTAIWAGLYFANRLVKPIGRLIDAAEKVGTGKFDIRLTDLDPKSEFGTLTRTFNSMTTQLETQRSELLEINDALNLKSIFMETVLAGVASGVIGLDQKFMIELINESGLALIGMTKDEILKKDVTKILPILSDEIAHLKTHKIHDIEGQLKYTDPEGITKVFLYRIAAEIQNGKATGYVLTFHDITDLISAQRKAAWSEVAKRIAHEIKNPLTPIQLSAERLLTKYKKQITEDAETFASCVETIVRQVEQIGRMVDEFSAFARMPGPRFQQVPFIRLCNQAVVLQETAHPDIVFKFHTQLNEFADRPEGVIIQCDPGQIDQVLKNILQNAIEAIDMKKESLTTDAQRKKYIGRIDCKFEHQGKTISFSVQDNGIGMQNYTSEQLTEPYVTTKKTGTGLGLAIAKKIIEDHSGQIKIIPVQSGVRAEITLPFESGRT